MLKGAKLQMHLLFERQLGTEEIEVWEGKQRDCPTIGSTVRRLRGNLLWNAERRIKGVLDLCGDSLTFSCLGIRAKLE